jgi:hypothetical protein
MADRKAAAIETQIKTWLTNKKIRQVSSNEPHRWNTTLHAVPKPGSFDPNGILLSRTVFNGKPTINKGLICDPRAIPTVHDFISRCRGTSWFTELDLADSYLQMRLHPDSQLKTCFSFQGKTYCFVGVPYGITFIGNTFQNLIADIFSDFSFFSNYIDNLWVHTIEDDLDQHFDQVMAVIARCTERRIRINLKKPVLFKRRFVGMGKLISQHGVALDPGKVQAALSWQPLSLDTAEKLASFLGACNYLRENIQAKSC